MQRGFRRRKVWISLTFGQLEAILAEVNGIASEHRVAFQARIRNFARLGFPRALGSGRGRAVRYHAGDVLMLTLAFRMAHMGIVPGSIVASITSPHAMPAILEGYQRAIVAQLDGDPFDDILSEDSVEIWLLPLDLTTLKGSVSRFGLWSLERIPAKGGPFTEIGAGETISFNLSTYVHRLCRIFYAIRPGAHLEFLADGAGWISSESARLVIDAKHNKQSVPTVEGAPLAAPDAGSIQPAGKEKE
jgi:hypothetical protein